MSDGGGSLEASMIFEKLFTDLLKSQTDGTARILLLRKLERLKLEHGILAGINIDGEESVSINIREGSEYQVVTALSKAFDSLIDVLAFSMGQEGAFRQAEGVLSSVMKQFQEPFSRLGVKNHILKGSMAEKISSGVDGLDAMLGGGFPRADMVLVSGPPGMAKYNLAFQFLAEGLKAGGSGMAVVSTMNTKEFRDMLSKLGVNVSSCEAKGRLKMIDWYSQKSRPIIGMEEHGSVLIPSKDIANLDIAFTRAMDGLSFAPTTRAFVDIITPALNIYELSDVVEFVQRQKSRFGDRHITSMFVVENGVHDERVMSTLKHISDTGVALTGDGQGNLFIEIEAMSTSNFRRGKSAVQVSYKGISVMEMALDEAGVIAEFCNIPLVTREVARKLVDAGFTDMNQLSRAEETELLRVGSITREIARSIAEYTRTVEYSQSVLSSRSDKWLKKAMEQVASGDLKKAKKSLERALEIDPANAIAQAELVKIERKLGADG
ncbi:MAG: ATPase domain-containing protein [Thermoplasmata archaeon]